MPSFKVASSLALSLLLVQVLPSVASVYPRLAEPLPAVKRDEGVIKGLLRVPVSARSEPSLQSRQSGSCRVGLHMCSDGESCCPIGYNCFTSGAQVGCCPVGERCSGISDECASSDSEPCAGKNFCCPIGDTCGVDSCLDGGSGPGPAPTRTTTPPAPTPTPTRTTTSTSVGFNTNTFTVTDIDTDSPIRTTSRTTTSSRTQTTIAASAGSDSDSDLNPFNNSNGASAGMGVATTVLIVAGVAFNLITL